MRRPVRFGAPLVASRADAGRRLAELTTTAATYGGPSALGDPAPAGFRLTDRRGVVGRGEGDLADLGAALRQWRVHRGAGLNVIGAPHADVGARVSSLVRYGPLLVAAPCVVTAVHDRPGVRGFSYATLPGHPERGEEAFVARLDPDDLVRLQVRAIWQPAGVLTRIALPLTVLLQRRATTAYVDAARDLLS